MKRENWFFILTIIVLAMSSALSSVLLMLLSDKEKAIAKNMDNIQSAALSLYNNYIEVDEPRVRSIMEEIRFNVMDDSPLVVMVLPPYPCASCLETELNSFSSFIQIEDISCTVLGTTRRVKDLQAISSQHENVSYFTYPVESFNDEYPSHHCSLPRIFSIGYVRSLMTVYDIQE